jgi:hypothetical protein
MTRCRGARTAWRGPVDFLSDHILAGAGHPAPAVHYNSHRPLLRRHRPGGRLGLDAIVVSASRPADNLLPALRLGAALDVPVVLMCSRDARSEQAVAKAAGVSGASCVVVDLSEMPGAGLPDFETSGFREAQVDPHGDLSRKRNLGLALGRVAGWRTMLFLDDDIVGLEPGQVKRAVAALDHHAVVGMPAVYFPDNSIVCHAHRLAQRLTRRLDDDQQDVFVSGSALAVDMRRVDSFFPDMYNEDWLFLAPHLDRGTVTSLGWVLQQEYAPFESPQRAGDQEFGEVLAEGLLGFLHSARLHPPPPTSYWATFLDRRAEFISLARQACRAAAVQHNEAAAAVAALEVAERNRSRISPADLTEYVDAWIHDLAVWRRFLAELPRLSDLPASIRHLDLAAVTVTSYSRSAVPAAPSRRLCAE